jgi:TolA-binding protein
MSKAAGLPWTGWGLAMALVLAASGASHGQGSQPGSDEAARQYAAAVALQNREVYDLAAEEWDKFIQSFPKDDRAPRAHHFRAVCRLQLKEYDQALSGFQYVVKNYPKFELMESTYLYLGLAHFNLGQAGQADQFAKAQGVFGTLLDKYPETKHAPQAAYYLADSYYQQGNRAEAEKRYTTWLARYREHELAADVLYALGVCQEDLKEFDRADSTYADFLARFPRHALSPEVVMRRGETLYQRGQWEPAEKLFEQTANVEGFALADHAAFRRAACQFESKDYAQAAATYAWIATKFPNSKYARPANLAAGKSAFLAGKYESARAALLPLLADGGPQAVESAHWIARAWLSEKKPAEALKVIGAVLKNAGDAPFAGQLALDQADATFEIADRKQDAPALYAAVAARYPNDRVAAEALYMAGFSSSGLGQHEQAVRFAREFTGKFAGHELEPDVRHLSAESSLQLGKYAEAAGEFRAIADRFPSYRDVERCRVRLGLALQLDKRHAEAIDYLASIAPNVVSPDNRAEALFLLGSSQLAQKDYSGAARSLRAAFEAQPRWRQADETLLLLASALKQSGQTSEALAALDQVEREFPQSAVLDRVHYRRGETTYAAGDFQAASKAYQSVIDRFPKSALFPFALYGLGWSQLSTNDYSAARTSLTRLIDGFAGHELEGKARYARGLALHQLKEDEAALADVQTYLRSHPSDSEAPDARHLVGLCQAAVGRHADAAATFASLLADFPEYAGADKSLYEWAWALKSQDRPDEAAGIFARLADQHPDSPLAAEALFHVGEVHYAKQDYSKAATFYYACMQKTKAADLSEKAVHKLGWSYFRQDNFENAARTFAAQRESYPSGPLAADAAFVQAECLFKQAQWQEALAAYSNVKGPSNPEFSALALLHAAQSAEQLKDWNQSLALAERAVKEFPESGSLPEALYQVGWSRQNLDQLDEAVKAYEQVTERSSGDTAARARFMVGEIYFLKKDHKEAIRHFFKVAFGYASPKWQAEAHYESGRCFEVLKNTRQARESYKQVVENFAESDKAPLARDRLMALGG